MILPRHTHGMSDADAPGDALFQQVNRELVECRRCPRLVEWRERVARAKRAAFRDQEY